MGWGGHGHAQGPWLGGRGLLLLSLFLYLFLAVLGLHCCTQAFSSCGKWGLLFVEV